MNATELELSALRRAFAAAPPLHAECEYAIDLQRPAVRAAVLVPILAEAAGAEVLLTLRSARLQHHAGQISFPGGRIEASDCSAEAAALRESEEEVGIAPAQVEVLGHLPEYPTRSGFVITPVVGVLPAGLTLRPDPAEVEAVFTVPLAYLLDAANYQRHEVVLESQRGAYWSVSWGAHRIWGATAGVLHMLLRLSQSVPSAPCNAK